MTDNPLSDSAPGTSASISRPTGSARKHHRVLIIDDSPEILALVEEILTLAGVHTLTAIDGTGGVSSAREHLPDLILCDVKMPLKDGYETLKELRRDEATATIPFIFLSGSTDRGTMRRGMELGADDFLSKPVTPKELMAAVTARIEKQAEMKRVADRQLNELRGSLTMALPHELRTPLNGIMGLSHLMMEDHASMPPEEVFETARFINESALRLHRLIENFLVYSQIELLGPGSRLADGSGELHPVAIQKLAPDLARRAASRHKRDDDLLQRIEDTWVLVPSENLSKIIEELVDNAFKFSEAGRPVLVATEVVDGRFYLVVADKGRGMTAEQIARIGPHVQFDRGTFEQQGAGLGLFVAKRLTELLGGIFHIDSKPGEGTTIRVSFAAPGI